MELVEIGGSANQRVKRFTLVVTGGAPIGERHVNDIEGVALLFDVVVQGRVHRYLVATCVLDGPFWNSTSTVRTIEFAVPAETFDKYAAAVRSSPVTKRRDEKSQCLAVSNRDLSHAKIDAPICS